MRDKIKRAMLLAAGYGTRLKPLTDQVPKPLVPVAGKPMIQYGLEKVQAYGLKEVVINVCHLKEQMIAWLAGCKSPVIRISEESEPLETGGALKHALPWLSNEPMFVINSDIIWTDESESALNRLTHHWDDVKMDFLLLAQSKSRAIGHDQGEDHLFVKPGNTIGWSEKAAPYIIAGIGIFHPRVLREAPDGTFSVKVLWREAMKRNRLFCLPHHGRWFQTGTREDIKKAEEQLKRNTAI